MSGAITPRSRAKRSTTNLSNLRLAPLSSKFAEQASQDRAPPKSPYGEETPSARPHSSYIQTRSTPSTPGVISRSSSRKRLSGGYTRTDGTYFQDNSTDDVPFNYAPVRQGRNADHLADGDHLTKAKSEAYLRENNQLPHQHARGAVTPGGPRTLQRVSTTGGTLSSSRGHSTHRSVDETWLMHTGATASALLQESKGQSWLSSRTSAAGLHRVESDADDDDEDENYEEMAASAAQLHRAATIPNPGDSVHHHSPTSTRVSRWGSRYGSRAGSRRTSRRASPTGTRTPRRSMEGGSSGGGYFDALTPFQASEPTPTGTGAAAASTSSTSRGGVFIERSADTEDEEANDREVAALAAGQSFGMGRVVDRFMALGGGLFRGDETDDDANDAAEERRRRLIANETPAQTKERVAAEAAQRRKADLARRAAAVPPAPTDAKGERYGWSDAAWLLSVASKALF